MDRSSLTILWNVHGRIWPDTEYLNVPFACRGKLMTMLSLKVNWTACLTCKQRNLAAFKSLDHGRRLTKYNTLPRKECRRIVPGGYLAVPDQWRKHDWHDPFSRPSRSAWLAFRAARALASARLRNAKNNACSSFSGYDPPKFWNDEDIGISRRM